MSIFFDPLIDVAGNSEYFYFVVFLRPISYPYSDFFSWMHIMSVLMSMVVRIDHPSDFYPYSCKIGSSSYTLRGNLVSPIDVRKVLSFCCTVKFSLGPVFLCGL